MRVKNFQIRLTNEYLQADEDHLNEFLKTVVVKTTTPQLVMVGQTTFWSVLVFYDDISSLEMNLENTEFTGSVNGEGEVSVTLDSGSSWTLTEDSYISSFNGDVSCIIGNGHVLYVNGTAINE
jgi:hypothetical protein